MKRIVICADGTWQSPESEHPTHVMRLARAIAPTDARGHKQVVFYDWGIGSDGGRIKAGITGAGIDKNIMDAFRFIVHNYDPGDALFLFGFSRGAYTVRSLAGFIRNCGILHRAQAARIPEAYELYRARTPRSAPSQERATQFRRHYAVADRSDIAFVGVWDTVGALGIPAPFIGTLNSGRYLFHDAEPSSIIGCARHAVAIDEKREDFEPTLWTAKAGLNLKQVWFPGVHTDIGGGYADHALGDHAGVWMMDEAAAAGLVFEPHFRAQLRPDHAGRQHNEYTGAYKFLGRGKDRVVEPCLHVSVRRRLEDPNLTVRSPALRALLESVAGDWSKITLEG